MKKKILISMVLFFWPILTIAQSANDIVVPERYKVRKIAEVNKAGDPAGFDFDSSGNLIVAYLGLLLYKVDINGNVEVVIQTRRFNFGPIDVKVAPDGSYIAMGSTITSPFIYSIVRLVPPDSLTTLTQGHVFMRIAFDNQGNLYTSVWDPPSPRYGAVIRYDANFSEVGPVIDSLNYPGDIVFDQDNNMYVLEAGNGNIWKIPAGEDGIPGLDDTPILIAASFSYPSAMTRDDTGYLFVTEWSHDEIDGFSVFSKYNILKVDPVSGTREQIAADFSNPTGLAYKDGYVYVAEMDRGVISKIDLSGNKTDLTQDYGIVSPQACALDPDDRLCTVDFRLQRLFRMDESGVFEQLGQGVGNSQTFVSDGTYFYLMSVDLVGSNGFQLLKINPVTGTPEVIGTNYSRFRSAAFDSYGRFILTTRLNSQTGEYGLSIINLATGEETPYIKGIYHDERGLQFDANQNLYIKQGIGDGLKKVHLDESYDPPRDISSEPLFYDFSHEPSPFTLGFFNVNHQEEVLIPVLERGQILRGDKYGNTEIFAHGFLCPYYISSDFYGRIFVSDSMNGIFEISCIEWSAPLIIENLESLIEEVKMSNGPGRIMGAMSLAMHIECGFVNSLCQKLENAIKSLERRKITPAIRQLRAFQNEVRAQKGKKIPNDLAEKWIKETGKIITVLEGLK